MTAYSKEQPSLRIFAIDIISVTCSFIMASFIRFGEIQNKWFLDGYSILFAILVLINIVVFYIHDSSTGFFRRGFFSESKVIIHQNIICAITLATIMYLSKMGTFYARLFVIDFFLTNVLINYLLRQYYKIIMLAYYKKSVMSNKMMVITTYEKAYEIIQSLKNQNLSEQLITSIAILDRDLVGKEIYNIPVKANGDNLLDVIRYEAIDEVFISIPSDVQLALKDLVEELKLMGIKVRLHINAFGLPIKETKAETFANYNVLLFCKREVPVFELGIKRVFDVIGAIVGLLCTVVITIILAPAIYIESPGPIFFSQIRIGKSGRRFRIYKFRSMFVDAEERKAELLEKNEMQGLMFKMTDDPRVTKVGKFLRKTSLDEFPQFFNVLIGEMSLVGTRPPTEDEFLRYESKHRRRLTLKPGLTGLWQVSGRSDISDFEDVVRLDLEYIDSWTLGLDVKLVIKTAWIVLFGRGAR